LAGDGSIDVTDDPDAIGPDGTVRLRCYLPLAERLCLSAGCKGRAGCGHVARVSIRAAIGFMGSGEATVGEFARHLRCSQCGNREVDVVIQPETRSAAAQKYEGPATAARAGLTD
jgi:hypothetical protein